MRKHRPVEYVFSIEDELDLPSPRKLADWTLCLVPSQFDLVAMVPCSKVWCASVAQQVRESELVQRPLWREWWQVVFKVNKSDDLAYALSEDLERQKRRRLVVEMSGMLVPSGVDWKYLLSRWDAATQGVPWWWRLLNWRKVWFDFVAAHPASLFYHDAFNDDFWIFANSDYADEIDQRVQQACNTFGVHYCKPGRCWFMP